MSEKVIDRNLILSGLSYVVFGGVLVFTVLRWLLEVESHNQWLWVALACAFTLALTWVQGRRVR